jgi:aspartyl-tRNA(Asn)/glutamyl-tRNA(Gln) amidotransferase subunit C
MKLSLERVREVAHLARLALTPEEEQRYLTQLSAILEAVDQLSSLDTKDVEPTSHANLAAGLWRPDVEVPSLPPSESLRNAPAKVGTSFAVPRILE